MASGSDHDDERWRRLEERLDMLEHRLEVIEAATRDARRRQVVAELRSDPGRLLSGVADMRRIVREDLDDLADGLSRWDVPLSSDEERQLRRAAVVVQGVSGPRGAKVHLVVDVVSEVSLSDLEEVASSARVLSTRSRRSVAVLVTLTAPPHDLMEAANTRGVRITVDD